MTKQILFTDMEEEHYTTHAGILMDDGNVICGCCGGLYEASERGKTWNLVTEFDELVSLEETIRG